MATTFLQRSLIRTFGSGLTSLFKNRRRKIRVYADGGKHMRVDKHGVMHIHGPAPSDMKTMKGIDAVLGVMTHECAHGWCENYPWFKWFIEEKSHQPENCPKELAHAVANITLDIEDERSFEGANGGFQPYLSACLSAGMGYFLDLTLDQIKAIREAEPWKVSLCILYFRERCYSCLPREFTTKYPEETKLSELLQSLRSAPTCTARGRKIGASLTCDLKRIGAIPKGTKDCPPKRIISTTDDPTSGFILRVPTKPFQDLCKREGLSIGELWPMHSGAVLLLHVLHALLPNTPEGTKGPSEDDGEGESNKAYTDGKSPGTPTPDDTGDTPENNPNTGGDGSPNDEQDGKDSEGGKGKRGEGSNHREPRSAGRRKGRAGKTKAGENKKGAHRNYELDGGYDPLSEAHDKIAVSLSDSTGGAYDYSEIPDHLAVVLLGLDVDKREVARMRRTSRQYARSLLVAPRSVACQPSLRGARLGNLTRLPIDGRVFNKRAPRLDTNTAVAVLLDASYSIGSDMRRLAGACQGMAEGLQESSHVTIKCWSFSDEAIPVPVAKVGRVELLGGTNTLCALKTAEAWLDRQMEPRKIILIFTDGSPNMNTREQVQEECRHLYQKKIVLVGGAIDSYKFKDLLYSMPHTIPFSLERENYSRGFRKAAEQVRRLANR